MALEPASLLLIHPSFRSRRVALSFTIKNSVTVFDGFAISFKRLNISKAHTKLSPRASAHRVIKIGAWLGIHTNTELFPDLFGTNLRYGDIHIPKGFSVEWINNLLLSLADFEQIVFRYPAGASGVNNDSVLVDDANNVNITC